MATKRLNPNHINPQTLGALSAYNVAFTALSLDKTIADARKAYTKARKNTADAVARRGVLLAEGKTLDTVNSTISLDTFTTAENRAKNKRDFLIKTRKNAMADAVKVFVGLPCETVYKAYLDAYDTKRGAGLDDIIKTMLTKLGVQRVDDVKAYNRFVAFIRDDIKAGKRNNRIKNATDTVMTAYGETEYINRFVCLFRDALVVAGMVDVAVDGTLTARNKRVVDTGKAVNDIIAECRARDKASRAVNNEYEFTIDKNGKAHGKRVA